MSKLACPWIVEGREGGGVVNNALLRSVSSVIVTLVEMYSQV